MQLRGEEGRNGGRKEGREGGRKERKKEEWEGRREGGRERILNLYQYLSLTYTSPN
jgi:hypothetical protein